MADKLKHALGIFAGAVAFSALVVAVKWIEPWFAWIQIGIMTVGALGLCAFLIFAAILSD